MSSAVETKRVFRAFWVWDDAKEEAWLGEMSRRGFHLKSPGSFTYTFEQGPPAEMTYRLDFQSARTVPKKDREEYISLFRNAGWQLAGERYGWYYFRRPSGLGPSQEIYTDPESRISKYRRVLAALCFFLLFFAVMAPSPLFPFHYRGRPVDAVYQAGALVKLACMGILLYITVRLALHIRSLKLHSRAKGPAASTAGGADGPEN